MTSIILPARRGIVRVRALVKATLLCVALSGAAGQSLAQSGNAISPGSHVTPVGALPMRQTQPEGFFGSKGAVIGQASAGRLYEVLRVETISTIGGSQTWLLLRDAATNQTGWVYSGSGGAPFQNVSRR